MLSSYSTDAAGCPRFFKLLFLLALSHHLLVHPTVPSWLPTRFLGAQAQPLLLSLSSPSLESLFHPQRENVSHHLCCDPCICIAALASPLPSSPVLSLLSNLRETCDFAPPPHLAHLPLPRGMGHHQPRGTSHLGVIFDFSLPLPPSSEALNMSILGPRIPGFLHSSASSLASTTPIS